VSSYREQLAQSVIDVILGEDCKSPPRRRIQGMVEDAVNKTEQSYVTIAVKK